MAMEILLPPRVGFSRETFLKDINSVEMQQEIKSQSHLHCMDAIGILQYLVNFDCTEKYLNKQEEKKISLRPGVNKVRVFTKSICQKHHITRRRRRRRRRTTTTTTTTRSSFRPWSFTAGKTHLATFAKDSLDHVHKRKNKSSPEKKKKKEQPRENWPVE